MKRALFSIIRKFWKMLYFRNPVKYARKIGVEVGNGTHFVNCPSFSSEPWLISIGERTNIYRMYLLLLMMVADGCLITCIHKMLHFIKLGLLV